MKNRDNSSYLEKLLYMAVEREKEPVSGANSRVDLIMGRVNELAIQSRFEARSLSPRLAFLYGLSIAATVLIGCFIGNMALPANSLQFSYESLDFIHLNFTNFFLPF